ncbi:hydroxymethylglutaryl-CoA lyase [Chromobacterium sinusclupearum]|uniref:hydroxymethylglutaryl-CoA lyase n=1 Tax=Chromobacterium sinusclupearum TaxID=2077146 RepID=A0A2K4MPQ0_9NEIS|nr:hydroxymethylglutaryl-CoA lyase [Chromobacterium sinusclupearum]POA98989.1 hydroxymethylglutaryl-CoA lyase [Chromobacterium sinusclupearum]
MQSVKIVEVGPRDGLQNEKQPLDTAVKLKLIRRLADSGLLSIEAGAFVSPKWVPQMAGSAEVLAGLDLDGPIAYPVLVPNDKGLDAALEAGVREIAVFGAASESFSQKNINASIAESLQRFESVTRRALDAGIKVRGYVSCVVGCPYEGKIAPQKVADVAKALSDLGCYEISLGDTIGVGTPASVREMLDAVLDALPAKQLAGHFHDTYGMAIANIRAALDSGLRVFDASVAGLGGCPYAKGASGNVATEDVVYLLHGEGYHTGIDLTKLVNAAWYIADALGKAPASKLAHALGRQG